MGTWDGLLIFLLQKSVSRDSQVENPWCQRSELQAMNNNHGMSTNGDK